MEKFTLEITLGNEAMADLYDVAQALRDVANKMSLDAYPNEGIVRDTNGNKVGSWELS